MRSVTVRSRCDGLTELAPRLTARDRAMVLATVFLVTGGLYLGGVVRPAITGIVAASCVVGELVLRVRAAALALLRPAAQVHDVRQFRRAAERRSR